MPIDRQAATSAVRARLAELGHDPSWLAAQAPADPDTVGDFLEGRRWPRLSTLAKFDTALGWTPGTTDSIARGAQRPNVSPVEDALSGVLLDIDAGAYADLSPTERDEAVAAAKVTFLERARHIRRARED